MSRILIRDGLRALAGALILIAAGAGAARAEGVTLQWFGQAAVKITTPGSKVILIDPFITKNPKTPEALKDLSKPGPVDLILITHGHGDHVGDTVAIAEATGAKVALNADVGHSFASLGWLSYEQMVRFNKGGTIAPIGPGITVTMVRAEHSSEVVHSDPETKKKTVLPGGEPAGYVVKLENGFTIYHAGDTGVFADMVFIGAYYKPDLTLLPIGGHFTMDPAHAAYALRELLKTPTVIPIHYGTFGLLKGTPEQFIQTLGEAPTKVIVMAPGETREFQRRGGETGPRQAGLRRRRESAGHRHQKPTAAAPLLDST